MRTTQYVAALTVMVLFAGPAWVQAASNSKPDSSGTSASNPWSFSLTADGYVVPHAEFFLSPIATADRGWLHLEARYNYEDLQTGSIWVGRSFSVGHRFVFEATPMIGGIFGNTTGVAPGYEVSFSYKRLEFSSSGEYVVDTRNQNGSFFYSWPELTYSPRDWLHIGLAAQRTKVYHTSLDTQRGVLIGLSHKKFRFTTYIFNPGWSDPTLVLELGWSF
jgi:hypothetical protein